MTPLDAYSPDYAGARSRFRALVAERGWSSEAHIVAAPGFADGDLTIDVARIGSPNAERLLVISSGLHGAEGFFGSAVQLAWIDLLPRNWEPPAGCGVLLLHALNPFGFAKIRRANEDNVDLNRNFLNADEFTPLRERTAIEYGPLDPYLSPASPPTSINWFPPLLGWMILRFGLPVMQRVMPAGQYAFPKGLFFGGDQCCRSTEIVMAEMPRWLGLARFVLHLDFHTGLGPYATYKLLASDPTGSERVNLALDLFGRDLVKLDKETEGGYHNHGDMGEWLSRRFADRTYLYLCAEFGTYGSTTVIGTLRRENQAHQWATPDSPISRRTKADMVDVFSPTSPGWRWPVVRHSLGLIQLALTKCAEQGILGSKIKQFARISNSLEL